VNSFSGRVWRYVPARAHALHVHYILQAAGRWNRSGIYGCLYTSLDPDGAKAEYKKYLTWLGVPLPVDKPRDLVSLEVIVARVLDLTDLGNVKTFGIDPNLLIGDSPKDLEVCRRIADIARARGHGGILSPCAANGGTTTNLSIYVDGRPDQVSLLEGPDRLPLNY
jgi:RES domain-containing protein